MNSLRVSFNYEALKKAHELIELCANKRAYRIIEILKKHGELRVTDIWWILYRIDPGKPDQTAVSTYLGKLRRAGVIKYKRDGKRLYYSIIQKRYEQIASFAEEISEGVTGYYQRITVS